MQKGRLTFNFNTTTLEEKQAGFGIKKYTSEQQRKQCTKAIKQLQKYEKKGKIQNLQINESETRCIITYLIP